VSAPREGPGFQLSVRAVRDLGDTIRRRPQMFAKP